MGHEDHKQSNADRLVFAKRKLDQLADQVEKLKLCGGMTIYIPYLRGKFGRVKATLEDMQAE